MSKTKKNKRFLLFLGLIAGISSVTMIAWAVAAPIIQRGKNQEMIDRADALLSTSVEDRTDLDAVDCDGADLLIRSVLDGSPHDGRARRLAPLAAGCSALLRGDLIQAEGALRNATHQLQRDPRPSRWLGALALMMGRPDAAETHFRRALELDPGHHPSAIGLSDALDELGRSEEALELLSSLELPPLGLIEIRRGMLFEALGRFDEAARSYRSAMDLSPDRAEPRNNLAALEGDRGNMNRAWELQLEAVERSPDDPVILLNGGLLAIALGHDERAEELLRRAIELDHDSANPSRALADHFLVRGRVTDALELLGPAIDRFSRDAALRNTLGNALAAAGRTDEALAAYRTSLEADASLAEPHNGLAALMMASGDLRGAEEELLEALRLDGRNTQARQNLAELRRRRDRIEGAEREGRVARALP